MDFNGDLDNKRVKTLMLAIDNGSLLPKGHGRLIDADALLKRHLSADYDCRITRSGIELAPTIIKAENEEQV